MKPFVLMVFGVFSFALMGDSCSTASAPSGSSPVAADNGSATATRKPAASKAPTPPPTPTPTPLTAAQQNAARSAQQYLSLEGFSRQGLIDQLSSSAGDGYSVSDATVAVDRLNVDWNAQAVRAAKNYLQLQGFSCSGLIEQLDSSAGDKFTVAQATYGAKQAGAC